MLRVQHLPFALILVSLCTSFTSVCAAESQPDGRAGSTQLRSVLTPLSGPRCKTSRVDRESGSSEQLCPGIKGYKLLILDSDNRMSVTVIAPNGVRHPLEFWNTVTSQFSELGKTAEWRAKQSVPGALILPLNVNDDPNSAVATAYLVVVRLEGGDVCAVAKIRGGPDAPADARRKADSAADATCLKQAF